jgi:hypothetical protein
MATNLRLRPATEEALRTASERTGRSQQDLIREAIDQYLETAGARRHNSLDELYAAGLLIPARTPYRPVENPITLPDGMTTADLLDREDRF